MRCTLYCQVLLQYIPKWQICTVLITTIPVLLHTRYASQDWLQVNCSRFIDENEWPPNFPDFNLLDYQIWRVMLGKYCKLQPKLKIIGAVESHPVDHFATRTHQQDAGKLSLLEWITAWMADNSDHWISAVTLSMSNKPALFRATYGLSGQTTLRMLRNGGVFTETA